MKRAIGKNRTVETTALVVRTYEAKNPINFTNPHNVTTEDLRPSKSVVTLSRGDFNWKAEAVQALNVLNAGKSLVLVGSAGTGKSTLVLDWLKGEIADGRLPPVLTKPKSYYRSLHCDPEHPRLKQGSPGFIMGALSHRVTQRLAKDLPGLYTYTYKGETFTCSVHNNVMTMHKATEYRPTEVAVPNKEGELEDKIHFVPYRGVTNPLPDIKLVILDEAGQIRLDLGRAIVASCPGAQFIMLGDLGQVGAVASLGLLGVAIASTSSVELKHIYRSEGALLSWGASIREGTHYKLKRGGEVQHWKGNPEVAFLTYPIASYSASAANTFCANILFALIKQGKFTFGVDMALCPQVPTPKPQHAYEAEKFGVAEIWHNLAEKLDAYYGRHTYLIRTMGGAKVVAVGDTYIIGTDQGQQEFMLVGMVKNKAFKSPIEYPPMLYSTRDPDLWVDYITHERSNALDTDNLDNLFSEIHEDEFDMQFHSGMTAEDKANISDAKSQYALIMVNLGAISAHVYGVQDDPLVADKVMRSVVKALELKALSIDHTTLGAGIPYERAEVCDLITEVLVTYGMVDLIADSAETGGLLTTLSNTGAISTMIPSITTVHKAQGSEAPTAVCMWHHTAAGQTRELIYTGNTRARLKVINICDADTFGELPDTNRSVPLDRQAFEGTTLQAKKLTYLRKLAALEEGPEAENAAYLKKFFKLES